MAPPTIVADESPPAPQSTFYAVAHGKSGSRIYGSWAAAQAATSGVSGCHHKRFQSEATARAFLATHGVDNAASVPLE